MIAGFAIFGIMYLYTFYAIIIDINKRYDEYRGLVEEDMQTMKDLGLDITSFDAEL